VAYHIEAKGAEHKM